MKTTIDHEEGKVRIDRQGVTPAAAGDRGKGAASHLTSEEVWREIAKASFAVIGYITPSGEPRSSGVVYKTIVRRLYVAVAPESWKARHIPASGRVAVTVPVRRGGILSLVVPIPPATVSFHGTAIVHPAGSPYVRSLLDELVPATGREASLRLHHRGRPRGRLRYVRPWRVSHEDARPGGRSGARSGDARNDATNEQTVTREILVGPKIEYFHASKFRNGAKVAEEFEKQMKARGVTVAVHHIREGNPDELPPADLYVFSSPGRFGKPIRSMRRFLKKVNLPEGTRYAILTTELAPQPDKKNGRIPTQQERAKWLRIIPIINEILQGKGLAETVEDTILVTGIKGPLKEGWQEKVEAFAARILSGRTFRNDEGTEWG